jgi:hypothetical protein
VRLLKCRVPTNPKARRDLARTTFHLEVLVSTRCRRPIATMNSYPFVDAHNDLLPAGSRVGAEQYRNSAVGMMPVQASQLPFGCTVVASLLSALGCRM